MRARSLPLSALLLLLAAGCQPADISLAEVSSVAMTEGALQLAGGDKLIGTYQGCAGHTDGDGWEAVLGSGNSSTLWVVSRDSNCQLWLSQLQRGNNEVFILKNPVSTTIEYPILIQPKFRADLVALAVRSSGGAAGTLVNVVGTGLDFAGSTFSIQLRSGTAAELAEINVSATQGP